MGSYYSFAQWVEMASVFADFSGLSWLELPTSATGIERVIFHKPATIVFWEDGEKTVVKTSPSDVFDKEKAILWAYVLKNSSSAKTQVQKEIAQLCKEGE